MSESYAKALESFVAKNPDLERLEQLLGQFNLFEALGVVRHELRHSDFLAFLLDPSVNHGLGDDFVRLLLQKFLLRRERQSLPVSLIDLDVWDLNEIEVYREWQNIDILLLDKQHQLVIAIENKIGTTEHSNQLRRYREAVSGAYPDWKAIYIFLTPDGDEPSDAAYIAADYTLVCEAVDALLEKRTSTLGADVATLIRHYSQMLRRHIVTESEIAELCRRIYRKHKVAIDLIFEHRPDEISAVTQALVDLISENEHLRLDSSSKTTARFAPKDWFEGRLAQGSGWTPSGQILLFECYNNKNNLNVILYIGPGPEDTRQTVFSMAQGHGLPFRPQSKSLHPKWNSIYRKKLLRPVDFDAATPEDVQTTLKENWLDFVQNDLPKLIDGVRSTNVLENN
jgi:hypothetical protein